MDRSTAASRQEQARVVVPLPRRRTTPLKETTPGADAPPDLSPRRRPLLPRPRPAVRCATLASVSEVMEAFRQVAEAPGHTLGVRLAGTTVELHTSEDERRFWSPWLSLQAVELDGVTLVQGRFGPHPHIWTGFVFTYAVLGLFAFMASMYGWAQIVLERPALGFAAAAGSLALAGFVYGAEFIGKGMAAEQLYDVRDFVDTVRRRVGGSWYDR